MFFLVFKLWFFLSKWWSHHQTDETDHSSPRTHQAAGFGHLIAASNRKLGACDMWSMENIMETYIYIYICICRCIHLCICTCTCICICLWICILHVHLYYLRGEQVNQQYRETRKPTLSPTNNAMGTPTWRIWYEDITRIAKESQFEALPPTCLKQDFVGMDNSWKGVFWCCRFCVTPGSRQFFWSTKKILQRQQHSKCDNFQYEPVITSPISR